MWLNTVRFRSRFEAGDKLAAELTGDYDVVLAIPRGGVVVGKAVAQKLGLPLGIVVTKKVGTPGQEELAVGAMGPDGKVVWDEELMARLGLSDEDLEEQIQKAKVKIQNYQAKFPPPPRLRRTSKIILVDDGVATGSTMKAAINWLRRQNVGRVVVAVPVCGVEAYEKLQALADEVVCLAVPEDFGAVGQFYEHFPQVTDEEVVGILKT